MGRLGDEGCQIVFEVTRCRVLRNNKTLAKGIRRGKNLYHLQCNTPTFKHASIAQAVPTLETWHRRLGHVNYTSIIQMAWDGVAVGMPTDLSTIPPVCQHCILGKQTKWVVPKMQQGERAQGILDINLTGPEDVTSVGGAKYILNFVDDMSGMMWTYLIKEKSQAEKVFVEWLALVQNETGQQAKCFRTDNGGEFTSKQFESYLHQQGIQHQVTVPYTSVQNGRAECTHHTIMDRARSIHSDLNLPANL